MLFTQQISTLYWWFCERSDAGNITGVKSVCVLMVILRMCTLECVWQWCVCVRDNLLFFCMDFELKKWNKLSSAFHHIVFFFKLWLSDNSSRLANTIFTKTHTTYLFLVPKKVYGGGWAGQSWGRDHFNTCDLSSGTLSHIHLHSVSHLWSQNWKPTYSLHHTDLSFSFFSFYQLITNNACLCSACGYVEICVSIGLCKCCRLVQDRAPYIISFVCVYIYIYCGCALPIYMVIKLSQIQAYKVLI